MADQRLQDLTEETAPASTDLIPISDNGTQRLRKIPVSRVFESDYNVKHYGSTLNNTTVQAAIDAANTNGGGRVYFPKGTYTITGTGITLYANIELVFAPGAVIDATGMSNSSVVFTAAGTETSSEALTSNGTIGDTTLSVASESAFSVGDYVKIGSTAKWTPNVTPDSSMDQRIGEIGIVASLAAGQITLRWPIVDSYATADSAFVAKLSLLDRISIQGPVRINGKGTGTESRAFSFDRVRGLRVAGISLYDFDQKGIELLDAVDAEINGITAIGGSSAASTFYGVSFNYSCQDCSVAHSYFRDFRHAVTLGGGTSRSGINRRISVIGNKAQDCTASAFDSHAGAEDLSLIGNTSIDSTGSGISLRCPAVVCVGNTIIRPGDHGIYLRNQSDRATRYNVSGNRIDGSAATGINYRDPSESVLDGTTAGQTTRYVNIVGNSVYASTQQGIVIQSAESFNLESVIVSGNVCDSVAHSSGRVIHIKDADFCQISNNILTNCGSTTDGMRIENCSHLNVSDNVIQWDSVPSAERGIQVVNSDDCTFGNNHIVNGTTGIILDSTSDNNRIVGGNYRTCSTEIVLGSGANNSLLATSSTLYVDPSNSRVGVGEAVPDYKLDVNGTFGCSPGASVTPVDNGDVVIEATNNTTLTFKLKGSDATVRSGTITLS